MNSFPSFPHLTILRACAVALATLTLSGGDLAGQTIPNPSFEADTFTVAPGTISANTPITGWTAADQTKAGLNPAGGQNPYANNGAVPNGTTVAFLIPTNVLSTTISGLEAGASYLLRFRANATNTSRPALRVALDGTSLFDAGGVASVGGANPYYRVALPFTASAAVHTLYLTNDSVGVTNVLLLDDFSVEPLATGWSVGPWTDDASSGVDGTKTYTHAYAFNVSGAPLAINGVNFNRLAGANPQVPYELNTLGLGSATTDATNALKNAASGSSSNLAHGFVYNGNPAIFCFQNLVPGLEYVATFYSVGWDPRAYGRAVTWTCGDDRLTVNQDMYGNDQGIRVSYRYLAPASGYLTLSNVPFSTVVGTYHTYGVANCEANPQTTPLIGVQPANKVSLPGGGAGFYVTAGGARPLAFRWMKDGTELPNQTNRTLILSNLTTADLAGYSVSVSNSHGVVTSAVATLAFDPAPIPNPSFEADTFLTYPGYINGNFPISGWLHSNPAKIGLNPEADVVGPFANNGVIPDGSRAAFLQSTSSLSTTISGLVPNQLYTLQFRANGRATQRPNLIIALNGQTVLDSLFNAVSVAGSNAYRHVAIDFTAPDTNALLTLNCMTNVYAGDHAVCVDAFAVAPSISKWSYAQWTSDETAGIDPTKVYTHAYHFGTTGADTTINGVTFKMVAGANPSVPGRFAVSGMPTAYTGTDVNVLTSSGGGSAGMSAQFIYNSALQTITLSNLLPGAEYVMSVYSVGWEAKTYGRTATFFVGEDRQTINQDVYGSDQGIIVSYRYTAPGSGTFTIAYAPTDSASTWHTYAFANRAANDSAPAIGFQPQNTAAAVGETATFSVSLSAGSLPMFFQWQQGGVDLPDQTNATLVLDPLTTPGITTDYRVIITNAFGAVTSTVASLKVGLRLTELFSTGLDDAGVPLAGGAVDPHYTLTQSADAAYPGPAARVLYDVWPVQAGVYLANDARSRWISQRTNENAGGVGLYTYRTSFLLDSLDPATAEIRGQWAMDNYGVDILLNGVSLGLSNNAGFARLSPFAITSGFVAGSNTLDFVISNAPPPGPTALRVALSGVALPRPPQAPQIVAQPQSQLVQEGDDVTLAVLALGSPDLTYQWYFEGIDLPNATNRVLRLSRVSQLDQQGSYWVTITNPEGFADSATAVLTVNVAPLTGDDFIACGSNQPVTVPVAKLAYNDFDDDGDAFSVSAVAAASVNGGTVTLNGGLVTFTPATGFVGSDQFTYTVQDARGGRGSGTVHVTVGATEFIRVVTAPALLPNGHFQVGYRGVPGYLYVVERATSVLGPWEVLATVYADGNGYFQIDDPNDPPEPMRFYRVTYP